VIEFDRAWESVMEQAERERRSLLLAGSSLLIAVTLAAIWNGRAAVDYST
jgi:hypothetical protein